MPSALVSTLAFAVLLVSATSRVCAAPALLRAKLVIFGDSLSDIENAKTVTQGTFPVPPYDGGRFTNGPVWNELLASDSIFFALSNNAYGGATTGTSTGTITNLKGVNFVVPSLLDQVAKYQESGQLASIQTFDNVHGSSFEATNQESLKQDSDISFLTSYFILAGANDYNNMLTKGLTNVTVDAVLANVEKAATMLATKGRRIILMTLPPLDKTPRMLGNPQAGAMLANLINTHNSRLQSIADNLTKQNSRVRAYVFDMHAAILEMIANPAAYDLDNVTDACLNMATGPCANPDRYLFWDFLHPTARGHAILADKIQAFLAGKWY
ncbi:hypothetical protein HK104_009212 [Borealophlyctis nickersoniae]|nr:hypothetical protein HK104_009212 [Borealophlyctis nickersoniae]